MFNDIQLRSQNSPGIVADTSNSNWFKFVKSICNHIISISSGSVFSNGSVFSSGSVFQCSELFEHLWMYNLWCNQLKFYCTYFVLQTYPKWPLIKRFWVLRNLTTLFNENLKTNLGVLKFNLGYTKLKTKAIPVF